MLRQLMPGGIVQFVRADGSVGQVTQGTDWGIWVGINGMEDKASFEPNKSGLV